MDINARAIFLPVPRRKFFDLARLTKAPIAIEAVARIDALFAIERNINSLPPQERKTSASQVPHVRPGDSPPARAQGRHEAAQARLARRTAARRDRPCRLTKQRASYRVALHWIVSHSAKIVIAIARGDVSQAEADRYFADMVEQGALPYRKLFRVARSTTMLDDLMIESFINAVPDPRKAGSLGPIAIVADDDDAVRKAQNFAAGAIGVRPLRIFGDMDEARRWLDTFMTDRDLPEAQENMK